MLRLAKPLLSREPSSLGEQSSLPVGRSFSDAWPGAMRGAATSGQAPLGVAPTVVDARLLTVDEHPEVILQFSAGDVGFAHSVNVCKLPCCEFAGLDASVPRRVKPCLRDVVATTTANTFHRQRNQSSEHTGQKPMLKSSGFCRCTLWLFHRRLGSISSRTKPNHCERQDQSGEKANAATKQQVSVLMHRFGNECGHQGHYLYWLAQLFHKAEKLEKVAKDLSKGIN